MLRPDWQSINCVQIGDTVLQRHGFGALKGFEARICVDPNAVPHFCKAGSVPYAMREKVEFELQRLVDEGIAEPVQFIAYSSRVKVRQKAGSNMRRFQANVKPRVQAGPIPHP